MKRRSERSSIGQIPDLKIELSKLIKFLGELRTGQGSTPAWICCQAPFWSYIRGMMRGGNLTAMLNRLPDIVRLHLTGNITYSPAADGKPAKVLLNFGQKLRPVTVEVTRSNKVSVVLRQ